MTIQQLAPMTFTASEGETFQINDIQLQVLPSDILAFSDNAVYEESFIRSKAVFAFRSKYSRGKIIITLPISLNPFANVDYKASKSQKDGLKVLHQLSNYPFCFIKSSRVRSYLSSRAKISSTDFMMFAVDEINIIHDMRVSDVAMAEIHLVFNDHTSQTEDFKFKYSNTSGAENPIDSIIFMDAFEMGFEEKFNSIFRAVKDSVKIDNVGNSAYADDSSPFNVIRLLAPNVLSKTEQNASDFASLAEDVISKMDYREVKVTAKNGNNSLTPEFLGEVNNNQSEEEVIQEIADSTQNMIIYWTTFHDLNFGGLSSIKTVKISLKNKLAQQFIGTHKYPFVQYLGRYPARVDISMDFKTGEIYEQEESSILSALGQINNILDYNNELFPEISAYNVIKIQSILTTLMGVESIIPNQTYISASSSNQGVESVNISFIEADVEEFMKLGKVMEGRPSQVSNDPDSPEARILIIFLKALLTPAFRSQVENSEHKDKYGKEVIKPLAEAVAVGVREFYGNIPSQDINKLLNELEEKQPGFLNTYKKDQELASMTVMARDITGYDWPNSTLGFGSSYDAQKVQTMLSFLERRKRVHQAVNAGSDDPFDLMYRGNGSIDSKVQSAYQALLSLSNMGDVAASSTIKAYEKYRKDSEEYLSEQINRYTGNNITDLPFTELLNPSVNPFFFLEFKPYFTADQIESTHNSIDKTVFEGISKIVKARTTEEGALTNSGMFGIFDESGLNIDELYIVAEKEAAPGYWKSSGYGGEYSTGTLNPNAKTDSLKGRDLLYDDLIIKHASAFGVDPGIVKAIIHQESKFISTARSPAGARGLMQLMPDTAKAMGVTDPFNPDNNIMGGTKYISKMLKLRNGDLRLALASYNAGPGNVDKYGDVPPFRETREYVVNVTRYYNNLYKGGLNSAPAMKSSNATNTNGANAALNNTKENLAGKHTTNSNSLSANTKAGLIKVKLGAVTDGDTLKVEIGDSVVKIRVRYLDTPETSKNESVLNKEGEKVIYNSSGNYGGEASAQYVKTLIKSGGYVWIENKRDKDNYGREVSNVYLDGSMELFAEKVIKSGNGFVWGAEQGGGSAVLNTLRTFEVEASKKKLGAHAGTNSKEVINYKAAMKALEEKLKATKSSSEVQAILEANAKFLGDGTFIYDKKLYDIKAETKNETIKRQEKAAKERDKAKNDPALQVNGNLNADNAKLPNTNKDVHVQGVTSEAQGLSLVTSEWGYRASSDSKFHAGLDISSKRAPSQNVIAAANGIVTLRYLTGGGKTVIIDHQNGFYTKYLHLKDFTVKHGQKVSTGQVVGIMGNTNSNQGTATSNMDAHLHQETWANVSGGPSTNAYNVHPFKTTSLKKLDAYDKHSVFRNIKKFISETGTSVTNIDKARQLVYGLGGKGQDAFAGTVVSGAEQIKEAGGETALASDSSVEGVDSSYKDRYEAASRNMPAPASVFYEREAVRRQAQTMCYYQKQALNISFPAVKIYLVVGSEVEEPYISNSVKMNYYFELDGLKDISVVCNNDDNPVDVLLMKVANPSFIKTDNYSVAGKYMTRDFTQPNTSAEASFISDRIRIKPGAKLHVRMGYSNDPNDLKTVFNGVVMEVGNESGICLDILAEGYGRELLMDNISPGAPMSMGTSDTPFIIARTIGASDSIANFGNRASRSRAIASTLLPDSVVNGHDTSDPETKRLTTKFFGFNAFEPGNWRQRIFTNVYAAEIERLHRNYNTSWWNYLGLLNPFNDRSFLNEQAGYHYIFHGQTPWAVLKEMEYRHPGTLVKPLFYQDRMTLFFGIKEQMYIARDLEPQFMRKVGLAQESEVSQEYVSKRPLRFDTVTGFHLFSSELNILTNNMKLNAKFNTGTNVVYFNDKSDYVDASEREDLEEFKMKVDDSLAAWDHRYGVLQMPGIHGKYSAFMYGTTDLRRQSETMYSGTITVVGNPAIKAGDYVYINDNLRRIEGMIKVRECKHIMNENLGFVTEITPGLVVEARNFIYSALFLKLSFTAKIALTNATLTSSIVSNDEIDFTTYQEYIDALQLYAKRKSNWFDSLGWEGAGKLLHETGGTPLAGAALSSFAIFGMSRLLFNTKMSDIAKGLVKAVPIRTGASLFAYREAFASIWQFRRSQTSLDLARYSWVTFKRGLLSAGGRGVIKTSWALTKSGITLGSAVAWYSATRSLAAVTQVAGALLLTNPIGWLIRVAISIVFSFVTAKLQENELTRQPLMYFPAAYNGRPFVAGISGYSYDTYFESKMKNWDRNMMTISKAGYLMGVTSSSTVASLANSWLSGRYAEEQIDNIKKSFKLKKQETGETENPFQ